MKRIVIFASGSGSNAENISLFFQKSTIATVVHILTNNKNAKVIDRSKNLYINSLIFNREEFNNEDMILKFLKKEAGHGYFGEFFGESKVKFGKSVTSDIHVLTPEPFETHR